MFQKHFTFSSENPYSDVTYVSKDCFYTTTLGYGFVTEKNRSEKNLHIAELNSAFDLPYWMKGEAVTNIQEDKNGCFLQNETYIPLTFKTDVPVQGNYNVTISIDTDHEISEFLIFTGRRRLAYKGKLKAGSHFEQTFTINVCDIIPRGYEEVFEDKSLDITIIGKDPRLTKIDICEAKVPTLFIAGDSTVTDQSADYPYSPAHSYSGWGQMISYYLSPGIAVSNHAHSGLTTESFRKEGHHAIVMQHIKAGDFFFMQFAHNDQKLAHLTAEGGYRKNIIQYIEEIRSKGAYPVIVTPLARNTWKGNDGSYNDLLESHANACIKIGEEFDVPVLDLHKSSMNFIKLHGLEDAKRYFFPGDYTHTNDFGAYIMAGFVAAACKNICTKPHFSLLTDKINSSSEEWIPPFIVEPIKPPVEQANGATTDANLFANLERAGETITRVEAMDMVIKTANFFPINVYNDMYIDVIGHEWYAGTVECAYQNGIIDDAFVVDKQVFPQKEVTLEEFLCFMINAYKARKSLPREKACPLDNHASNWALSYIRAAYELGFVGESEDLHKLLSRQKAADKANLLLKQMK